METAKIQCGEIRKENKTYLMKIYIKISYKEKKGHNVCETIEKTLLKIDG